MKKRLALLLALAALMSVAAGCSNTPANSTDPTSGTTSQQGTTVPGTTAPTTPADPDAPIYGGVLRATINTDPVSMDPMLESSESELIPASHIFETALTSDLEGSIHPGVCTIVETDNTIELILRDNVKFHNGNTVTIEDVEASATRWLNNVKFAQGHLGDKLESMTVDGNKLIFTFNKPAPLATTAISAWDRGLYIIPKEVCEKYPDSKIENEDLIGTGPYVFKDQQAKRFILMEKFEDYVPYVTGASGLAAEKYGYVDHLYFYPVADKTARITGVQTGEYDVGIAVPSNMLADFAADPNLKMEIKELGIMPCVVFNFTTGPCSDVNLRNAILACLDMDDMMMAAQGDESLYYLNPNIMMKSSRWWTGEDLGKYNNVDLEKAREYLDQSSYNGEKLVYITTKDNDYFYKTAMVLMEKVKEIGIEIDLQVYDNATLGQYRNDPEKFDMFSAGLTAKADPTLVAFMEDGWAGFYSSEAKAKYYDELTSVSDFDARYAAWVEMSKTVYEELPLISFGERTVAVVTRDYVHNLFDTSQKFYWNTWVSNQ